MVFVRDFGMIACYVAGSNVQGRFGEVGNHLEALGLQKRGAEGMVAVIYTLKCALDRGYLCLHA